MSEATRVGEDSLLEVLEEPVPWLQTSSPPNFQRINICCFKPQPSCSFSSPSLPLAAATWPSAAWMPPAAYWWSPPLQLCFSSLDSGQSNLSKHKPISSFACFKHTGFPFRIEFQPHIMAYSLLCLALATSPSSYLVIYSVFLTLRPL